jgi:rod shape-determining protein MreB
VELFAKSVKLLVMFLPMTSYTMRTQHNLLCESTEKIKSKLVPIEDQTPPEDMSVQGRDLLTGKPKQMFPIEKLQKHRQINSTN